MMPMIKVNKITGEVIGMVTFQNCPHALAPSTFAAS